MISIRLFRTFADQPEEDVRAKPGKAGDDSGVTLSSYPNLNHVNPKEQLLAMDCQGREYHKSSCNEIEANAMQRAENGL